MSNNRVDEDNKKLTTGFQVEFYLSPDPSAEERLKRAISLVLRSSKITSESDPKDSSTPASDDVDPNLSGS